MEGRRRRAASSRTSSAVGFRGFAARLVMVVPSVVWPSRQPLASLRTTPSICGPKREMGKRMAWTILQDMCGIADKPERTRPGPAWVEAPLPLFGKLVPL